ncbi:MAG: hypothetical protein J6B73_00445 [Methanobrevibacter sp.]|nr:hypothetical protein [Methanobrevibacter sp.]MBO5150623.1 hypothetical protein [Methanobrevibacter sp.]
MKIGNSKQKPLRDLDKFSIGTNEELDSVKLKKKSGHGKFNDSFLKKCRR